MEGRHFARGALALAAAGLLSRFLGVLYLIPLPRLIGDQGMGLLQMGAAWQGLLVVLASAGLPMAVARGVAEQQASGRKGASERLLSVGLLANLILGIAGTVSLWWAAVPLALRLEGDSGAAQIVRVFAPSVLVLAVASTLRGYYQGRQEMGMVAASEVVEQLFRVLMMLAMGWWLAPAGVLRATAGVAAGAVVGGLAALALLVVGFVGSAEKREAIRSAWWQTAGAGGQRLAQGLRRGAGRQRASGRRGRGWALGSWRSRWLRLPSAGSLARTYLVGVAPAGAALALTYATLEAASASVIPLALRQAGLTTVAVRQLYGQYALAFRLIHIPAVLSLGLASTLLPAVAYARAAGRLSLASRRVDQSLRFIVLVALPAAAGLAVLASPLAELLFGSPGVAVPLRAATPAVIGLMLFQAATGALQGLGRPYLPAVHLGIGGLLQLLATWYGITLLGSRGGPLAAAGGHALSAGMEPGALIAVAAGAAAAGWLVAAMLNVLVLTRSLGGGMITAWQDLGRPLLATGGMAWAVGQFYPWAQRILVQALGGWVSAPGLLQLGTQAGATLLSVALGGSLYALLLAGLGGISPEEKMWLRRWLQPWRWAQR